MVVFGNVYCDLLSWNSVVGCFMIFEKNKIKNSYVFCDGGLKFCKQRSIEIQEGCFVLLLLLGAFHDEFVFSFMCTEPN